MKAFLKNYRQSPRKVRLVTDSIKGKKVAEAILTLDSLPKRASLPVKKLLNSAVSNAQNENSLIKIEDLFIENITVDEGVVLKRIIPRARGRASRINKRTSHVKITLKEEKPTEEKSVEVIKETKSTEEKKEVKKEIKTEEKKTKEKAGTKKPEEKKEKSQKKMIKKENKK